MYDIEALVRGLGIEPLGVDVSGEELIARCPGHVDTGNPNWSINLETGRHHCFRCSYGGGILGLIADRKGYFLPPDEDGDIEPDIRKARRWAMRYREIDPVKMDLPPLKQWSKPKAETEAPAPSYGAIGEVDLALFTDPPQWALDARHISAAAAAKHGVRWNPKQEAWILPIREPFTHYLYGWQVKGQRDRLFRNHPVGVEKSRTLFGLEAIDVSVPRMIVVESPLDVVRFETAGITGATATFGSAFSKRQLDLIPVHSDCVVVAMDNPRMDKAGLAATTAMVMDLRLRMPTYVFDYDLVTAKDPGDMTNDQLHQGVVNARRAIDSEAVHA